MRIMMKSVAALAVLSLGACAQLQSGWTWLESPAVQQEITSLEVGGTAFVCKVAATISAAAAIEAALASHSVPIGSVVQADTQDALVTSQNICSALNGVVTGTTVVSPAMAMRAHRLAMSYRHMRR